MRYIYLVILLLFSSTLKADTFGANAEKAFNFLQVGNVESAVNTLKRGAATNDVLSQYYIAYCYEHGIGVDKNEQTAFLYFRRGAERGFAPAMYQLARFYKNGIGIARSASKADEWTSKALKRQQFSDLPDIVLAYMEGQNNNQKSEAAGMLVESVPTQKENVEKREVAQSGGGSYEQTLQKEPVNNIDEKNKENQLAAKQISDVDIDIPSINMTSDKTFALVIANENYQDVSKVENAINDGEILAKYFENTLGIPQKHIHFIKDATFNNVKRELNFLSKIADAYKGDASFIVYYAGHGIPDEHTQNAYLMPVDGFSSDISTCISLDEVYSNLNTLNAKKIIVLLDACFSGATRNDNMLFSARGVRIKPKATKPQGNCIVLSSTQGDETAYSYPDQNHGLFTYFLLKKLKESRGDVNLGELINYLQDNVLRHSLIINGKTQTPTVQTSENLTDNWKEWTLH